MKRYDNEMTMVQLLVALLIVAFVVNTALFICVVVAQETVVQVVDSSYKQEGS